MKTIRYLFILVIIFSCSNDESNGGLEPPVLTSPKNQTSISLKFRDQPIDFYWEFATSSSFQNNYIWYLDDNRDFSSPFQKSTTLNLYTFLDSGDLKDDTTYYWKVAIRDDSGRLYDSNIWSFHIKDEYSPSSFNLVYPLDNTECSNNELTFEWEESIDPNGSKILYDLIISKNNDFNPNYRKYLLQGTRKDVVLPKGEHLYWKVEASDGLYVTSSKIRSLYTQDEGINNTIPYLEYSHPNDKFIISGQSVLLEWIANDSETTSNNLNYKVYFSEVGQDLELKIETTNILNYQTNGLEVGKTYQWSVWVTDGDGATNVGDVYTFTLN